MGSPVGPGTAGSTACPSCHAPIPAGSRFCNACGASLAPLPPPPPSPIALGPTTLGAGSGAPVDIRARVEEDRGILKRLQLMVPGFRGYRQGEDARAADSFLRMQIADKTHRAVQVVQDCRQSLSQAGQFQGLTDLSPLLADLQQLEGEIRHAEQGYAGVSAALRVSPAQLDQLYQYDYGFAEAADQVTATLGPLRGASQGADAGAIAAAIATARGQVRQLDTAFKARIRAMQGILVQ